MPRCPLLLSRSQILRYRQVVGSLDVRPPFDAVSIRTAAWAGLQDSVPRAALLSIHARVSGAASAAWEDPSLVQFWGPRYSAYVAASADLAVFTLGRLARDTRGLARARETAARMRSALGRRSLPYGDVGRSMGVSPNSLRYAAPTGTVVMRWDGARQPTIRMVRQPEIEPESARVELVRRFLRIFGPGTVVSYAKWAGVSMADAIVSWRSLEPSLTGVQTPLGEAWILAQDETAFTSKRASCLGARLLPSGDAYWLLWGADRALLVPTPKHRALLWTTRVWPGALLLDGEIVGVWRRADAEVSVETWRRLTRTECETVEAEVRSLPLAGVKGPLTLRLSGAGAAESKPCAQTRP
jgi:hypothetical protein